MIEYQRLLSDKTTEERVSVLKKMSAGLKEIMQQWTDECLKEGKSVEDDLSLRWAKMVAYFLAGWLNSETELLNLQQQIQKDVVAATRKATRRK